MTINHSEIVIADPEAAIVKIKNYKHSAYMNKEWKRIDNVKELLGGNLPVKNQQFHIVTKHNINAFTFPLFVIQEIGKIDELIGAIYRIGNKTVEGLFQLQEDGKIDKITLLINDGFKSLIPDVYKRLQLELKQNEKFKLIEENNHTKIALMKAKDNYYVLEGSGNWSINARIEQYVFLNSKEIYDFHKDWIMEIN